MLKLKQTSDVIRLYDVIYTNASQLSYIMGLYRKHRSVTEHRTEVSPIGYQALAYTNTQCAKLDDTFLRHWTGIFLTTKKNT